MRSSLRRFFPFRPDEAGRQAFAEGHVQMVGAQDESDRSAREEVARFRP